MEYPDGSFIDYAYNARNLLANVISDAPPPVATYTYNLRNQIAATVTEHGLFTATRSYDAAGRLTGVTNGALDSTGYTLSPDGRRTGIARNGESETYDYDNARQVTSASYGGLSTIQSWNYDNAGNRSSATTNGLTTTYLANTVNEYTSITGAPAPPMYDANGNALSYPVKPVGSSGLVSGVLTWNINNELIAATVGTDSASYQYDALGRRTKRTEIIGGVTTDTWFFTNGWNVELEHDGSAFTRRMTWGLDLSKSLQGAGGVGGLVMSEELPSGGGASIPNFPTFDGNGNITAWVNASGTVTARQRYDAYGNIIEQTGTPPSNYGFSTKPMDQVTGLLYYGYRYYDPITGRWPSRDPIEERGGINLYGFVGNDGVGRIDVLGRIDMLGRNPTLGMQNIEYELGTCGSFGWLIKFLYSPESNDFGIILQEVSIDIHYQKYDEFGFLGDEVYREGPELNPYHEAWDASYFATMDGAPEDAFHWKMRLDTSNKFHDMGGVPNSTGEATFTGYARFYPNLQFDEKMDELVGNGWQRPNPKTWARDLWAGDRNPGWLAAGATASSLVTRTITVKWDCCNETNKTELVSKSPL